MNLQGRVNQLLGNPVIESSVNLDDLVNAVHLIYKKTNNPLDGGECGDVAVTLMSLCSALSPYAVVYNRKGYEGISHVLVSDNGHRYLDGMGVWMNESKVLSSYDPKDIPTIEHVKHNGKSGRSGFFFTSEGLEMDASVWKDYQTKLLNLLSV